jgi:hypothetical protein
MKLTIIVIKIAMINLDSLLFSKNHPKTCVEENRISATALNFSFAIHS